MTVQCSLCLYIDVDIDDNEAFFALKFKSFCKHSIFVTAIFDKEMGKEITVKEKKNMFQVCYFLNIKI